MGAHTKSDFSTWSKGQPTKGRVFGFFAVEGDKALVGDGTAIDSNVTLGRFSGRLETPEESFSLIGWDEARQPSRSLDV